MITNFEKVGDFLAIFGHNPAQYPFDRELDSNFVNMKVGLIEEELKELRAGIEKGDKENIAKELADLLYVVYGVGHMFGINLDNALDKVHKSNMTKLGADGRPVYREDGKIAKGPNYKEPDLSEEVHPNTFIYKTKD